MKKHFAEYNFPCRRGAKTAGVPMDEFYEALDKAFDREQTASTGHRLLWCAVEIEVLDGNGTHYFIESEALANRLIQLGRFYDPRVFEVIEDERRNALGIVHTCGASAVAVLYGATQKNKTFLTATNERSLTIDPGKPFTMEPEQCLVVGLCLYLACFPEACRDGFPSDAKHPAHYKGEKCASVGAVAEIIEREGPRPHFRNGHFRILRSKKFTNKRWQVVFVREAFIKGAVKTVGNPPEE
jgi:hypothetical protein